MRKDAAPALFIHFYVRHEIQPTGVRYFALFHGYNLLHVRRYRLATIRYESDCRCGCEAKTKLKTRTNVIKVCGVDVPFYLNNYSLFIYFGAFIIFCDIL